VTMFVKFAGLTPELSFLRSSHSFATQRMADAQVFSYVDVLRTLRRSINKGGQLYSAESPSLHASRTHLLMCVARAADSGDYSGCYETYLAAANEVAQHSNDEDIRGILDKAKADVLQLSNPTEQAWGLRVAFDQIKDRGRHGEGGGAAAPVTVPAAAMDLAVASAGPSMSAEDKEKAAKAATKVMFVCREVYETEESYVADLQTIIHIFMQPASPRVRTPGRPLLRRRPMRLAGCPEGTGRSLLLAAPTISGPPMRRSEPNLTSPHVT
jgi:hypothetical protein